MSFISTLPADVTPIYDLTYKLQDYKTGRRLPTFEDLPDDSTCLIQVQPTSPDDMTPQALAAGNIWSLEKLFDYSSQRNIIPALKFDHTQYMEKGLLAHEAQSRIFLQSIYKLVRRIAPDNHFMACPKMDMFQAVQNRWRNMENPSTRCVIYISDTQSVSQSSNRPLSKNGRRYDTSRLNGVDAIAFTLGQSQAKREQALFDLPGALWTTEELFQIPNRMVIVNPIWPEMAPR